MDISHKVFLDLVPILYEKAYLAELGLTEKQAADNLWVYQKLLYFKAVQEKLVSFSQENEDLFLDNFVSHLRKSPKFILAKAIKLYKSILEDVDNAS